jgi:hypothetical protein
LPRPTKSLALALILIATAFLFPVFAPASASASIFGSDAPDWLKTAARVPLPTVKPHTPAVVLSQDVAIFIDDNGKVTRRTRIVYKILNHEGRDLGTYDANYDKDEKITGLHAWTITPDGKVYEVKLGDSVDVTDNDNYGEGFSDLRKKVIRAMLPDTGNIVAFEIEERDRSDFLLDQFYLQNIIPIVQHDISLTLPSGWSYSAYWTHHPPVAPEQSGNTWHWRFGPVPAIDFEDQPLHPEWDAVAPRLLLDLHGPGRTDQAGTWLNAGQWYDGLMGDRLKASPAVAAKAAELTAGKSAFLDKVNAIAGFVQANIRYYAIEIGISGYQPHHADEVLQRRYGDCKDKATLLIAMLGATGIRAFPLVVDTNRGSIDPNIASPFGNHMITAIVVPPTITDAALPGLVKLQSSGGASNDRVMIFDPTDSYLPAGQIPSELQGSYGLLVDGKQSQLLAIPVLPPEVNVEKFTGQFELDDHGALSGTVSAFTTGAPMEPWRDLFRSSDEREQRRAFEEYLTRYLAGPTLEKFSAENAQGNGAELTLHASFKAPDYAKNAGGMLLVRPRVINSDYRRVQLKGERLYPVEFDSTVNKSEDYTIRFPAAYTVEDLPDPVNLDFGFATYSSRTESKGNELHFVRDFQLKQAELSTDQYAKLRDLMNQIQTDESSPVMLKKAH